MAKYGKETRIQRANERQKAREKRSNKDQLLVLDKRLGEGVGAKKERFRLTNEKPKVSEEKTKAKKARVKKEKVK